MLRFLRAVLYYLVQATLGLIMAVVVIAFAIAPARSTETEAVSAPTEIVGASWSYPSGEATVPRTIHSRYAHPGLRMSVARVERIPVTLSIRKVE